MGIRETLQRMPEYVTRKIAIIKKDINNDSLNKEHVRREASGYFLGLRDAGIITERERGALYIYSISQ